MIISLETENKIEEMVEEVRNTTRVGEPIVIIITKDKTIINPEYDKKNKNYSYAYGQGYNAGRNDRYDNLFTKSTKRKKDYQ